MALPLLLCLAFVPAIAHAMDKTMEAAAADAVEYAPANPDEKQDSSWPGQDTQEAPEEDARFASIMEKAEKASKEDYRSQKEQLPPFLSTLSLEQWQRVKFKPEYSLWRGEGLAFIARFFAPGSIFNRAVAINVIDGETVTRHNFSPAMFDFGNQLSDQDIKDVETDFAGFRLLQPARPPAGEEELATFIGATFFRSKGRHSGYGVFARGLALNLGEPEGEEFPYFSEFWLAKPRMGEESSTVYALLESPRMTGAYKFIITPGASTVMDVSARFFLRAPSDTPKKIGIAPMSSMFLFSESSLLPTDDYRPEVHNSDGLLFTSGETQWFWRPLNNPSRLSGQQFSLTNPAGFGLMQRDADFDHYLDIDERFDRRASLWVEPKGNWGQGHIELIEIPTRTDINSNIHAFWVPKTQSKEDGSSIVPSSFRFDYRLYWMQPGVSPHLLGKVASTRFVRDVQNDSVRFIVDFEGESLKKLQADTGLSSIVDTPQDAPLLEKRLLKNPATGGWRLDFTVRVPKNDGVVQSIVSARDGSPPLRFRAMLKKGENLPDPLTETWVFDLPTQ
ncbi:glucan biosynthesis protein [Desulfovibrio sp. OttesenSCG-928-G15]|nr:glucan biosynthesis protein [Desulfovibrio sp. OttesenSCG-928-G15]